MTSSARHHRYAYADYVALEAHSSVKHEFLDGEIYAMAGGTPRHAALCAAVLRAVGNRLPSGCRSYTSDLRVRVASTGLSTYPDGTVVCGPTERAQDDDLAVINPKVLLEVTSPSSEEYDRGKKLLHYMQIASLREIVIVSHTERRLTLHRRDPDGTWSVHDAGSGEATSLESLGGPIEVDAIYDAAEEA